MRRHSIHASFYIIRMVNKAARSRVRDRLGDVQPQDWECEMVKMVEPGKRSVRMKREIIAEALRLDRD